MNSLLDTIFTCVGCFLLVASIASHFDFTFIESGAMAAGVTFIALNGGHHS